MLLHCSVQQRGHRNVRCKPTECVVSIFIFFQGNEEDSDEIGIERATPLISGEVLDERTSMIGTATDSDDEEVPVILRSMKSAVGHFVEDKKYLSE